MLDNAITLLTLRGIEIRVTPSWVLIALLVVAGLLPRFVDSGAGTPLAITMAVTGAVLFFLSILAHELGHALEAQRRGVEVAGITLFLFGGVTEMHMEAEGPRDEFAVAAIGPYVSFVLAAVFGLLATAVDASRLAEPLAPVSEVAGVIGWLNVLLALFNLIPGAPLDGGRVLRSLAWALTADRATAMRLAARFGQAVALLLVPGTWALFLWATGEPPRLLDLLWLAFIGWFMFNAAQQEIGQAALHEVLDGRTLGELPLPALPTLDPAAPLESAEHAFAQVPAAVTVLPVSATAGHLDGVLARADLDGVAAADRTFRTVGEIMRPTEAFTSSDATAPALTALRRLAGSDEGMLVERRGEAASRLVTDGQATEALRRLGADVRLGAVAPARAAPVDGAGEGR